MGSGQEHGKFKGRGMGKREGNMGEEILWAGGTDKSMGLDQTHASTKGDVYSFGILVLEMVTRKRATDDMFVGGLRLHKWVKNYYYRGRMEKIIDSSLVRVMRDESSSLVKRMWEVAIGELIELGLGTYSILFPLYTMLAAAAAADLDRLKRYFLSGDTTATFTLILITRISSLS